VVEGDSSADDQCSDDNAVAMHVRDEAVGRLAVQNVNLIVRLDFELAICMMQWTILSWYLNRKR
jgi:hypothetical protein